MKRKDELRDDSPIHCWFNLSYANYLVLQRSLLEGMPFKWQKEFIKLLDEIYETYNYDEIPTAFWVRAREGNRFFKDIYSEYRRPPSLPYKENGGP